MGIWDHFGLSSTSVAVSIQVDGEAQVETGHTAQQTRWVIQANVQNTGPSFQLQGIIQYYCLHYYNSNITHVPPPLPYLALLHQACHW